MCGRGRLLGDVAEWGTEQRETERERQNLKHREIKENKKRRGYRKGEEEGKGGVDRGEEGRDESLKVYVTSLLSLISVVLVKLFDNFGLIFKTDTTLLFLKK